MFAHLEMATIGNIGLALQNGGVYRDYQIRNVGKLEADSWIEIRTWGNFMRTMRSFNFSIQTHREQAFAAIAALQCDAPFTINARFPEFLSFAHLTPEAEVLWGQLQGALSFKDRAGELERAQDGRTPRLKPDNNAGSTSTAIVPADGGGQPQSYNDSLAAFVKGLGSLRVAFIVVNRTGFETANNIVWIGPAQPPPP